MASTVVPGVPPNIALLTGPILLGNLFGYGLYGVLSVQLFIYYHAFPKDSIYLKSIVYLVFFIDTLITVFATIAGWNGLAKGWGDLATLTPLDWPFVGLPLLSGLVASILHYFFAWRIWKLTHYRVLPLLICLVSAVAFVTAGYSGIRGGKLGILKLNQLKPTVTVWLGGSTLVDVVITISMVTILFKAKNSTMFQSTSSGISKLITVTVETGMATAVGALAELVLFIIFSENNLHFIIFLMLAKLYSNTLLATLNSRGSILNGGARNVAKPALWNDETTRSIGSSQLGPNIGQYASRAIPPVQISTITERHGDDMEMFVMEKNDRDARAKRSDWV